MNELKIYKVVEKWRKPLKWGISIEDVDKYLNYEDVKHWFYVKGFIDNWFYIAVYDSLIIGYYFRNIKKGGKVEILPDFRKNGRYGYLDVYKNLLKRLSDKFPEEFQSTVCLINIPSLSTFFKNGFIIDDIIYYENKKTYFVTELIKKYKLSIDYIPSVLKEVYLNEKSDNENRKNRKIKLNLYYEYGNICYKYDVKKYYNEIKNLFKNHNRELKCFIVFKGEIIYLEKDEYRFIFPDNFKTKFNLYAAKYKLIIPNKAYFKRKKEEIKERIEAIKKKKKETIKLKSEGESEKFNFIDKMLDFL